MSWELSWEKSWDEQRHWVGNSEPKKVGSSEQWKDWDSPRARLSEVVAASSLRWFCQRGFDWYPGRRVLPSGVGHLIPFHSPKESTEEQQEDPSLRSCLACLNSRRQKIKNAFTFTVQPTFCQSFCILTSELQYRDIQQIFEYTYNGVPASSLLCCCS